MQKKVLIGLFALLSILISIVLLNLLSSNATNLIVNPRNTSPLKNEGEALVSTPNWTKELANSNDAKFSFPVNELFMQIDLKKYIPPKVKSFRLVINKSDRYSLFCVVQTLSQTHMPFVIEKKNKIPEVYVRSKDKKELDKVVDKLKYYDIDSKIIEVWL